MFLIIQAISQVNKAAAAGDITNAQIKRAEILDKPSEESKDATESTFATENATEEPPVANCYSLKLKKEMLERAVFLAVNLGDFAQACEYQKDVVLINDEIYATQSHPLQGLQMF